MTKRKPDPTRERLLREGYEELSPDAWTRPNPEPGTPGYKVYVEAIKNAGAALANALATIDAKSPRQAAEDACRGQPHADVDRIENLIREERGLPPIDRAARAETRQTLPESPEPAPERPAPARRRRKPATAAVRPAEQVAEPAPHVDPLAALVGMSKAEKRELAAALAAELGDG